MTQRDEYLKAAAGYSVSLMSDTKWRKLFTLLHRAEVKIEHATWHFIDVPRPMTNGLPRENELAETRFRDGRFQPFEYNDGSVCGCGCRGAAVPSQPT